MTTLKRKEIFNGLADKDYRDVFVEENIGMGLAYQIRALRERETWTQEQLGKLTDKAQETISQLENPAYRAYTLKTLRRLAAAFDVGLLVRFVPFSELVDWTVNIGDRLTPKKYDDEATQLSFWEPEGLRGGTLVEVATNLEPMGDTSDIRKAVKKRDLEDEVLDAMGSRRRLPPALIGASSGSTDLENEEAINAAA